MAGLELQTAKELKFIREQTTHCAGDLGALRKELHMLRAHQEDLERDLASVAGTVWEREKRLELSSYGEHGTKELKACHSKVAGLERELLGQKACHSRVAGLEKELQGQGSQLDVLRQLVRDVDPENQASLRELRAVLKYDLNQDMDRKLSLQKIAVDRDREASCCALEARMESLAEKVNQVQLTLEASRKSAQAALDERLSKLEVEIMSQVGREMEALNKVSREMSSCNVEVSRLKEAVGDAARRPLGQQQPLLHEPLAALGGPLNVLGLSPGARVQHLSICERLEQLEKSTAESERKHSQGLEVSRRDLHNLESTHQLHHAQQSSMAAQLANLEKICQDLVGKQNSEIEASRERSEQMRGTVSQHQTQLDDVSRRVGALVASETRHSAEISAIGARLEQAQTRLVLCEGQGATFVELKEAVVGARDERTVHEAQLKGRIDHLEERLGEAMGKQSAESEALQISHSRQLKDIEVTLAARNSAAIERVDSLDRRLAGCVQSQREDAASANSRLEQLQTRVAAQEAHKSAIGDLKIGQSAVVKEVADMHAQQASLVERLGSLESTLAGAASKSSADTEALRAAHAAHVQDLEAAKAELARGSAMTERLVDLERRHSELHCRHGEELQEVRSRLEQLSGRLSASEVHGTAVEDLRRAHASSVQEQAMLQVQQTDARERLGRLEGLLASQAEQQAAKAEALADALAKSGKELKDKHAADLGAALARLDVLQSRLVACEQQSPSIVDLKQAVGNLKDERAARDAHQYTVLERMDRLESMLGDTLSRQTAESETHKAGQASHMRELEASTAARHAAVVERIDSLERSLGSSSDKGRQDLAAAGVKLEQLQSRLSACEAHGPFFVELKAAHAAAAKEVAGLQSHQKELAEKLDLLEGKMVSAVTKSTANAEALRRTDVERTQELETLRGALAQHAATADRIDRAERNLSSFISRHSDEGVAIAARLEQLGSRLSAAEVRCASMDELKRAHDGTVEETARLRAQHNSLRERLEAAGGLAEWHTKQLEAVKDAQSESVKQLAGVHADHRRETDQRLASYEQHSLSIAQLSKDLAGLRSETLALDTQQRAALERLGRFEAQLGDGFARQDAAAEASRAAHTRHVQDLEALVLSRHAGCTERLESLEKAFGGAIEGHRSDLAASCTRLDQLHTRLAACEVFRGQHSMICDRLDGLESQLGVARGKLSAEVEAVREAQARHATEVEGLRVVSVHQAGAVERLPSLERSLGDVASRQSDALSRLEQLAGRLAACEEHGAALGALRRGQLASEQMAGQLQVLEKDVHEIKARQADLGKLRGVLSNVRKAWDQEAVPAGAGDAGGRAG